VPRLAPGRRFDRPTASRLQRSILRTAATGIDAMRTPAPAILACGLALFCRFISYGPAASSFRLLMKADDGGTTPGRDVVFPRLVRCRRLMLGHGCSRFRVPIARPLSAPSRVIVRPAAVLYAAGRLHDGARRRNAGGAFIFTSGGC